MKKRQIRGEQRGLMKKSGQTEVLRGVFLGLAVLIIFISLVYAEENLTGSAVNETNTTSGETVVLGDNFSLNGSPVVLTENSSIFVEDNGSLGGILESSPNPPSRDLGVESSGRGVTQADVTACESPRLFIVTLPIVLISSYPATVPKSAVIFQVQSQNTLMLSMEL